MMDKGKGASSNESPTDPSEGEELPTDDCKGQHLSSDNNRNPTGSFVAACLVRQSGNRVEVVLPLVEGSDLQESAIAIVETLDDGLLDLMGKVRRLPVSSLADPQIALVIRPSLERLVKAARDMRDRFPPVHGCAEGGEFPVEAKRIRELDQALESFKDIA